MGLPGILCVVAGFLAMGSPLMTGALVTAGIGALLLIICPI